MTSFVLIDRTSNQNQQTESGEACAALTIKKNYLRKTAREFWADVPHRNRDHQAYGAVRRVHSFFPYYNVTDARIYGIPEKYHTHTSHVTRGTQTGVHRGTQCTSRIVTCWYSFA